MKTIKAKIIADSVNSFGDRLTSLILTYPRIIHSELMTHRMFSRNSASSRAIPFKKMVEMVEEDPFIPVAWQKDHKGMQGTEYITDELSIKGCEAEWLEARNKVVEQAKRLSYYYVTKQLCNRLLEPFMWHTVLVTATEYTNFYELRCPKIYHAATGLYYKSVKDWNNVDKDIQYTGLSCLHPDNQSQADIHIQVIAEMMWDAYNESTPKKLEAGEWHIPFKDKFNFTPDRGYYSGNTYINGIPIDNKELRDKLKVATARCARISYETLGDNPKIDYEADIKLHDKLIGPPFHASPFEHCAKAMDDEEYYTFRNGHLSINNKGVLYDDKTDKNTFGWCNNFKGFIQYRYLVENEKIN